MQTFCRNSMNATAGWTTNVGNGVAVAAVNGFDPLGAPTSVTTENGSMAMGKSVTDNELLADARSVQAGIPIAEVADGAYYRRVIRSQSPLY